MSRKPVARIPIKIAVVGYGSMGRNHVRVISKIDRFELCAIVEPERAVNFPDGIPLLYTIGELEALEVDAVVVATPTSSHKALGTHFLERGIHTLIEKPVCSNVGEVDDLIAARNSSGAIAMVGHLERFNPAVSALKSHIERGTIGGVFQIATRRQGFFPARVSDVGVTKDLAIHDIDIARFISGTSYLSLFATLSRVSGREHEDMIVITGLMNNSILVNHLVNWVSPMKERVVTVTGSAGTLVADTILGDLVLFENGTPPSDGDEDYFFRGVTAGKVVHFTLDNVEPLRKELQHFADAILGELPSPVSLEDAQSSLRIAEVALDSASTAAPRIFPL